MINPIQMAPLVLQHIDELREQAEVQRRVRAFRKNRARRPR